MTQDNADLDLSWFSMRTYESPMSLRQWVNALEFRLSIEAAITDGSIEKIYPRFHEHLGDLSAPPAALAESGLRDDFSTPSIALMNVGEVADPPGCLQLCQDLSQPYDLFLQDVKLAASWSDPEWLPSINPSDERVVHVKIDLARTDAALKKEFSEWLAIVRKRVGATVNRKYDELTKEWTRGKYLPYYDLKLFCRYKAVELSQARLAELLEMDPYQDPGDVLKTPRRSLEMFKRPLVRAMAIQLEWQNSGHV